MKFSDNIKFLCKLTGKCCIHNQVVLNPLDIFDIGNFLQIPASLLFKKKILTYIINKKDYWMDPIINLSEGSICPFLKYQDEKTFLCDIHQSRPTVCRVFPFNYNYNTDTFKLVNHSGVRCKECFETENLYNISDFVEDSGLKKRFEFQREYREFISEILKFGYSIDKIKGDELKKPRFFRIQKILYETYPNQYDLNSEFPWNDVRETIRDIILF